MSTEFCPKCGTPRSGAFRFRRSCGLDFEAATAPEPPTAAPAPTRASEAAGWIFFLGAVIFVAGLVWIWVNTASDDLAVHVFILIVGGAIWLGILWVVMAVVGFFGVLGAALTFPFWRRRK